MNGSIITVTTDYIPGCDIIEVWSAISVYIEDYEDSDVLKYAQRCLERAALEKGADGIIGFRLTSSSTYTSDDRITPEVFAYGTPVRWEYKDRNKCEINTKYLDDDFNM